MSNNDYKLLWAEAVKKLKEDEKITDGVSSVWFDSMKFDRVENNNILVEVPSKFYRDQVKIRYVSKLEEKLKDLIGFQLTIDFKISTPTPEKTEKENTKQKSKEPLRDRIKYHPQLNKKYSFDQFVIGRNNEFAANAAKAISVDPGSAYNPLLMYGGVGLGKTHLMQAIGNAIFCSNNGKKIIFITADTFTSEFIEAIKKNTQSTFKSKYRNVDILLIDDIHYFEKTKETQEELFHTFNALYDSNKQIVFTCDRPPRELKNLTNRLKSRFERGLTIDLQPPSFETRSAILRKKIETLNVNLPDDVIDLIASEVSSNVRDLEGSLTTLIAYSDIINKEITLEIAREQLSDRFNFTSPSITTVEQIQNVVADYFNVTVPDLIGKKRSKTIVLPRHIAMYIIREITDYSTTETGQEFGGRDHTTVMHACQSIEEKMKVDTTLEPTISQLIHKIQSGE